MPINFGPFPSWIVWLSKVLGLAAAYYVTGRLGLLLAIPPGYATAVWPPAGIALAGLLLGGSRLWPGIWLGSFLVNVATSFDGTSTQAVVKSLAIAASIGVGAVLQAQVGALLIRRFVTFPNPLVKEREIVSFLLLGGPASCLVNATIGVSLLLFAGLVTSEQYPYSWWTWWVGDSIGVMTVTPLIVIWTAEPRSLWRSRRLTVALPLGVTFALAVVSFVYVSVWEQERLDRGTWQAWSILAGGLLFTSILGAFLLVVTGRTALVAALVAERTDELRQVNDDLVDEIRERRRVEQALQKAHDDLEARVVERTTELVKTNEALRTEIATRQRTEDLLKRTQMEYQDLYESAPDMFLSVDAGTAVVTRCNQTLLAATGYTRDEIIGVPVFAFYHSDCLEEALSAFRSFVNTGEVPETELQVRRKDGSKLDVSVKVSAVRDHQGHILSSQSSWRDISERKQLVAQRSRLIEQLITAREEEQRRIARDLHDGIGQLLTSLLVALRVLENVPTLERMRERLRGVRNMAASVLDEVQKLVRGLRPSVLDDMGLAAALERQAEEVTRAHGIAVEVNIGDVARTRLPEVVETALYRIAQEALTNCVKHAAARSVHVELERSFNAVQLIVADNGRGFNGAARSRPPSADNGLGLSGMRERANLLDGSFDVQSKPGSGTTVRVCIPLKEERK